MRPLRWKSRYHTGNRQVDRRSRAFFECVNSLIEAAGRREHCREMEEVIARLSTEAEGMLREQRQRLADPDQPDPRTEFGRRLLQSLPLGPYGGNACRHCGLCDLVQDKITAELEAPAECLFGKDSGDQASL